MNTPKPQPHRRRRASARQRKLTYLMRLLTCQHVMPVEGYPIASATDGHIGVHFTDEYALVCLFNPETKRALIKQNWNLEKRHINYWADLTIEALRNLGIEEYDLL